MVTYTKPQQRKKEESEKRYVPVKSDQCFDRTCFCLSVNNSEDGYMVETLLCYHAINAALFPYGGKSLPAL